MTGRDLIVYILENHLENEELFNDGNFLGFLTIDEAAVKLGIGTAAVIALFELGKLPGVKFGEIIYIFPSCEIYEEI